MKVVIAAGGTGGHIYPGIAIAEELKFRDPDNQVLFIGGRGGLEDELIKKEGFEIRTIAARGLLRKFSYKAISAPFVTFKGLFDALFILRKFRPDGVIVTGGYVSFPVIAAAKLLRIPVLLHEQNTLPGFTNRFWSSFADVVTLSFDITQKYIKGTVTGNPVRYRIREAKRKNNDKKTLLIWGGSQGARSINQAIVSHIDKLSEWQVIHVTGERDFESISSQIDRTKNLAYRLLPYVYNVEDILSQADLVVSRAGATAIFEMLALGLPAILIPFPYSAEGHQELNAKVVAEAGAAAVLDQSNIDELSGLIERIMNNENKLAEMGRAAKKLFRPDAAKVIVNLIYAVVKP
ncbi:undecaprenyldiphospho-muramoylpentapeptide beta-N-acetylglucosaminyltransferase [Candidatus Saganbacteria bacterium]|nr:undecaprenyldiphospho-muramoylpentapeptide beta-N-acetylglucosaminyltransferase [Candidatus Saganbacteria bacterium]